MKKPLCHYDRGVFCVNKKAYFNRKIKDRESG
jgi:hypothetical protein